MIIESHSIKMFQLFKIVHFIYRIYILLVNLMSLGLSGKCNGEWKVLLILMFCSAFVWLFTVGDFDRVVETILMGFVSRNALLAVFCGEDD